MDGNGNGNFSSFLWKNGNRMKIQKQKHEFCGTGKKRENFMRKQNENGTTYSGVTTMKTKILLPNMELPIFCYVVLVQPCRPNNSSGAF